MTFTITDRDIRQYDSTTWLRCEVCGGPERVEDLPDDDGAMDEAERLHGPCYACLACGEPIGHDEASALCHYSCRQNDPSGSAAAMVRWNSSSPTSEWLARMQESGRRIDRLIAANPFAS